MFERRYFSETTALNLPSYNPSSRLYFAEGTPESPAAFAFEDGFFILRNQELEEHQPAFEPRGLDYADTLKPTPGVLANFSDMSYISKKIYDNQKVTILST